MSAEFKGYVMEIDEEGGWLLTELHPSAHVPKPQFLVTKPTPKAARVSGKARFSESYWWFIWPNSKSKQGDNERPKFPFRSIR